MYLPPSTAVNTRVHRTLPIGESAPASQLPNSGASGPRVPRPFFQIMGEWVLDKGGADGGRT